MTSATSVEFTGTYDMNWASPSVAMGNATVLINKDTCVRSCLQHSVVATNSALSWSAQGCMRVEVQVQAYSYAFTWTQHHWIVLIAQSRPALQGEPSVFVSEAADLASRAAERPRGTKNARQIAGRDYEHSSTCQARACAATSMSADAPDANREVSVCRSYGAVTMALRCSAIAASPYRCERTRQPTWPIHRGICH